MIISYDNLITRLWLSGAIMPYETGGYAVEEAVGDDFGGSGDGGGEDRAGSIDTMIDERGLPPVPHQYWVDRLGFQQDDPVTDFRSGGVSCSAWRCRVDVRFLTLSWARTRVLSFWHGRRLVCSDGSRRNVLMIPSLASHCPPPPLPLHPITNNL